MTTKIKKTTRWIAERRFVASYLRAVAATLGTATFTDLIADVRLSALAQYGIALAGAGIAPLAKLILDWAAQIDPDKE